MPLPEIVFVAFESEMQLNPDVILDQMITCSTPTHAHCTVLCLQEESSDIMGQYKPEIFC
jgi:hypothetical protein